MSNESGYVQPINLLTNKLIGLDVVFPITLLISERTTKVLGLLANRKMTLTELQRELEVSKPMALKVLSRLEREGLVRSHMKKTRKGREKVYVLEPFSVILSYSIEDRALLAFRSQRPLSLEEPLIGQIVQPEFQEAVEAYLEAIPSGNWEDGMAVILFGSVARGEGTRKSDIDLLFVANGWTKKEKEMLRNVLADNVHKAGFQVVPHFWAKNKLLGDRSNMAKAIREEGMIVLARGEVSDIWRTLRRYRSISL